MSKRGNIKISRKQIIEYWKTCQDECELSVDWAEAEERCWRYGYSYILYSNIYI